MFTKGDKVYWTDPEGLTSGWYEVRWDQADYDPQGPDEYMGELPDDIVALVNDEGTEVEALRHEVSATMSVKMFPTLTSRIIFALQTGRQEFLTAPLKEAESGSLEETALSLAYALIGERNEFHSKHKTLKRAFAKQRKMLKLIQKVVHDPEEGALSCPMCGSEMEFQVEHSEHIEGYWYCVNDTECEYNEEVYFNIEEDL